MASYEQRTTTTSSSSSGIGLDRGYLGHYLGIMKVAEMVLDLIGFICASVWINWGAYGAAWVQFVTMSAFVTTLLIYIFHLFRIIYKLPGPWGLIEFIYYAVYSLLLLIAAIVCAVRAHWHSSIIAAAEFIYYAVYSLLLLISAIVCATRAHWHSSIVAAALLVYHMTYSVFLLIAASVCVGYSARHPSIAFAVIFVFAATAVYIVDTFFCYKGWRSGTFSSGTTTAATTTTTTTTQESYETRVQY